MIEKTIETDLVYLYKTKWYSSKEKIPKIPQKEYNAIYEIFNSVGKNPKNFYKQNNLGNIQIENNSIVYLDIYNFELCIIPDSIENLENLEILSLNGNNLNSIPEGIGNLKNLKELYLRRNQFKHIPQIIQHLKNLKVLDLGYSLINNISEEEIEMLTNLRVLYIEKTPLTRKPTKETKKLLNKLRSKGVIVWDKYVGEEIDLFYSQD